MVRGRTICIANVCGIQVSNLLPALKGGKNSKSSVSKKRHRCRRKWDTRPMAGVVKQRGRQEGSALIPTDYKHLRQLWWGANLGLRKLLGGGQ
jgi:hypothetical protein